MELDLNVLRPQERASLQLRLLYEQEGFRKYHMGRFEEYGLYQENHRFLSSEQVITFTDLDGRLLALKPDVTLSIAKNAQVGPGGCGRYYYQENVYRPSQESHTFREISQMGLECIGAVDDAAAAQVVSLALRSLALTGRDFVLEISHMGFVTGLFDAVGAQEAVRPRLLTCIRDKNVHELRKAAEAAGLSRQGTDALCRLGTLAGPWQEVLAAAEVLALNAAMGAALEELRGLCRALEDQGQTDHWKLDFSLVNDMEYYNGLVLQGYLAGAPRAVLRGGQYDPLAEQFRPGARAIGFALYLDELDRLSDAAAEPAGLVMLNVALPKGRLGDKVYDLLAGVGYGCPENYADTRKLVVENRKAGIRYFLVKPSDVAIYVEHGAADIGIVGKDILAESGADVYELLDTGLGRCRMCVADAGGVITVKDVAIGGDLGDLASARGQIGDNIRINTASDLNAYTKAGNWLFSDAAAGENFPNIGRGGELNCYVSTTAIFQFFTEFNNNRRYIRYGIPNSTWTNWIQFISVAQLGDGIRNTNGIISVPEYEGATASSAGTSGLVPPAAAGQHESFLTGGGEYKPALSTGGGVMTGSIQINDLENAIGAAPSTNTERGLFLGDKNSVIMGGFDVIQRASDNAKYTQFYSKNSSGHITSIAAVTYEDGTRELVADSPLQINDIQIKQVVDGGRRVIVLSGARGKEGYSFRFSPDTGEAYMDGRVIHAKADTAGYADTAGSAPANGGTAWAANRLRREGGVDTVWNWAGQGGQPGWLWGGNDGVNMYVYNPANFSVNYANSAGQAQLAAPAVQWVVNTSGPAITVPQGGTYNVVCICFNDSGGKGAVKHYPNIAGGTVIPNAPTDYMVAGLCARVA